MVVAPALAVSFHLFGDAFGVDSHLALDKRCRTAYFKSNFDVGDAICRRPDAMKSRPFSNIDNCKSSSGSGIPTIKQEY